MQTQTQNEQLQAQLRDELGVVAWRDLKPHHVRGAVFMVAQNLDLVDVAVAVAVDDIETVKAWLISGEFARLDPDLAETWSAAGGPPLQCVITQPYVLIQTVPD